MPRLDDVRADLIKALGVVPDGTPPASSVAFAHLTLFERIARVSLNQVATPKVAESAFDALRDSGMLEPAQLASANPIEIDEILKGARVAMAIKSLRPLQNLARWLVDRVPTLDDEGIARLSTDLIRDEWRAINGIGMATADALLLFGLGRTSYPVDRASYRIMVRHSWIDPTAEYDEARTTLEKFALPHDQQSGGNPVDWIAAAKLGELSSRFARLGRDFCKPSQAKCDGCPLRPWLPLSGPIEVE